MTAFYSEESLLPEIHISSVTIPLPRRILFTNRWVLTMLVLKSWPHMKGHFVSPIFFLFCVFFKEHFITHILVFKEVFCQTNICHTKMIVLVCYRLTFVFSYIL